MAERSHSLRGLLQKRLLVVSGKGGVGKTTVSAALALVASSLGKSVLLVKFDDQGRTASLFETQPAGDRVTPLRDTISAVNLVPSTIVADYFHKQLRIKSLVRHIMNSKLFVNWFRVSPAIKEMILLGKVWDLVEERSWWRNKPVWDLVIFDAPATGHGLGILQLPDQATKLLLGPMRKNALGVKAMLDNPKMTSLLLVTLPEEMPVNETVHFYEQAQEHLRIHIAGVVLNAVPPLRFGRGDLDSVDAALEEPSVQAGLEALVGEGQPAALRESVVRAATYSCERRELADLYRQELRKRVNLPVIELPYVFAESFGLLELEALAGVLKGALEAEGVDVVAPAESGK